MNKNQQEIIKEIELFILKKLENLDNCGKDEKFIKADMLFNLYKVLENYDELEPMLIKYFNEKAENARFKNKDGGER